MRVRKATGAIKPASDGRRAESSRLMEVSAARLRCGRPRAATQNPEPTWPVLQGLDDIG